MNTKIKTAEFVSPMHPDKICDRISASILDECLKQDPNSRVAIETLGGHKKIVVMGEITTNAKLNFKKIIKDEINDNSFDISINIVNQSSSIATGVDNGGAGDQGIMVGYACNNTINFMPLEYNLARDLCQWIYRAYPNDGKVQITIEDNKFKKILVSWCGVKKDNLERRINYWFFKLSKTSNSTAKTNDYELLINPSGDWDIGGFDADTGLTGRKIVIDSYGPEVPVGGGAFSGKDPTKVDLSGALMARKIAVETLKSTNSNEVVVKVAYAIGKPKPIQLSIKANDREINISEDLINRFITKNIFQELNLKKPQYKELSKWGHFGNNSLWDN